MTPNTSVLSFSSAHSVSSYPRSPEQQLLFRVKRRGDIIVLSVRGQADAYTLQRWRSEIGKAVETAAAAGGTLIVDTTRLEFLSLRSLAALAEDAERYRGDGVEICLVTANTRIARLADIHPLMAYLPVRSTVVGAETSLRSHRQAGHQPVRPHLPRIPHTVPGQPEAEPVRPLSALVRRH